MKRNDLIQIEDRLKGFGEDGRWAVGVTRQNGAFQKDENDTSRKVERCIAYMAEHINQPLQVATLAALVNISPSHFFALFKQLTGCPPMDYFTRLRMRHACRLLGSTSASVKEVAAALGYDDPFYFSRVFKAVNRVPPSQYRWARRSDGEAERCATALPALSGETMASV